MEEFTLLLGKNGVIFAIGLVAFIWCYRNSIKVFNFIETQTLGNREYIMSRFELLFLKVSEKHVTIVLLSISFGLGLLVIAIFSIFGLYKTGIFLGAIAGFVGWKLPRPIVNFMVEQRIKKYQYQMVDALNLLSNGIRAGLSVPQSLAMVVDELPPPVSQEFNLMLQQNRIGVPLEECFENLLERIPTEDNEMFVTSVNVLRETGGNLAETFDTIVEVIRERVRLMQKIDTYVAQGKFQAAVIALMPFVLGGVFMSTDPRAAEKIMGSPIAIALLVGAVIMDLLGVYVISKVIKIKV